MIFVLLLRGGKDSVESYQLYIRYGIELKLIRKDKRKEKKMDFRTQAGMGLALLKQYGIRDFYYRFREWCDFQVRNQRYQKLHNSYFPSEAELQAQRRKRWDYEPLISIIVPTYETDKTFLRQLLDSVLCQTYGKLELCLADGSKTDIVENVVKEYKDTRISYKRLEKNKGISENTNRGFEMAQGEYLALLDHDDLLTPNALYEMVKVLNKINPRPDMIYSDEDKMVGDSTDYCDPNFKPDYNEELLRRNNYICHFLLFSKEILKETGGLDASYDGAQDHEFVLRCKRKGAQFYHIPKVLYHWRIHPSSTAYDPSSKLYAYENGKRAIQDYLSDQGIEAKVALTKDLGVYQIKYVRNKEMKVAVLVAEKEQLERLKKRTKVSKWTKVSYYHASNQTNREIKKLKEDYILFVGKGMEPEGSGWLEELLGFCQEKRVGAVTGSILTTGRKILQCGMMVSVEGKVYPLFEGLPEIYRGYCHRADIPENVSTLSLSFVLFSRIAWEAAGKIPEELSFPAREVEFFAKMRKAGFEVVVDNKLKIICSEKYRTDYKIKPEEYASLKRNWESEWKRGDLAYNQNLWEGDGKFTFRKKERSKKY